MVRFNLDITKDQHRQLKTLASYDGLSMKDFVLSRVFTEAAQMVFQGKNQPVATEQELDKVQQVFFDKSQIIVLSESKWAEFKSVMAKNKRKAKAS